MSNATRKHVRAAIVATAARFAELRAQWSVREDLADLTSRVETALADATAAINASGDLPRTGDHLIAVENTPDEHHMVVCTLCSCYPWDVLGLPPVWYKSAPYRSKVVMNPRSVLADFKVTLPESMRIRVWDSTAETRFLVLPRRPEGTEGWSEEQLAALVTRDSMIGTGLALPPREVKA